MSAKRKEHVVTLVDQYHPYVCAGAVGGILLSHAYGLHPITNKFVSLQYLKPTTGEQEPLYGRGWEDAYFVVFMILTIALLRWVYRSTVLKYSANYLGFGPALTSKWLDCGWVGLYYTLAWSWAVYVFRNHEWFFDTKHFWIGYPHALNFELKIFYLVQLSFWLTNLGMFFLEAQRRDYWQFLSHHCVTISLITSSYYYHFHRIGAAILLIQDVGDILYYHVKMLKYAGKDSAATIGFAIFMVVWFISRHVCYGFVLYSVWFEFPQHLGLGYNAESGLMLTPRLWLAFSSGLLALQGLLIFWFVMIVRLAIRVLKGQEASDETDDDAAIEEEMRMIKQGEGERAVGRMESKSEDDDAYNSQGTLVPSVPVKEKRVVVDGADTRERSPSLSPPEQKKNK